MATRRKRVTIHEVMEKVREGKRLTLHEREILARHIEKAFRNKRRTKKRRKSRR